MSRVKPFVVCHMLTSLDGKIDGAFFGAEKTAPALTAYSQLRGFFGCQATLYGTNTMLGGYAKGRVSSLPEGGKIYPREDYVNPEGLKIKNFIVSVDPEGILEWDSHIIEKKGRPTARWHSPSRRPKRWMRMCFGLGTA